MLDYFKQKLPECIVVLLRLRERSHELKKGLFSELKLSYLLHSTGLTLELKRGTLLAHVNAP